MKKSLTLIALTCAVAAAGCNKEELALQVVAAKGDTKLTGKERAFLVEDVKRLAEIRISPQRGSIFSLIFGGTGTTDVLKFLDTRVKYVVSKKTPIDRRLVETRRIADGQIEALNEGQVDRAYTMASNVGVVAWLISEAAAPKKVGFVFGERVIPVTSSRVGIIQLGEGYTKTSFFGKPRFSSSSRQATLIHEGRHSDCTGGLSRADLERVKKGTLPSSNGCGHLHGVCPAGHTYAGIPACDTHAWGAYAVEAVYAAAITNTCSNCTETEKQEALATAADSLSRIARLDDMLKGRLGMPDMSSSGIRD